MADSFKDHFSSQASVYTRYRPQYPRELFAWLAQQVSARNVAWDCATGNGQAAVGLTEFFPRVIATDASESQIVNASAHPTIEFRVAPAECSGLDDHSVELVTVAQAAHWFDHNAFAAEVQRVLKPGCVVGLWCYELQSVTAEINAVIQTLYEDVLGGYWPPERHHIETAYREIPFPFKEIEPPPIHLHTDWTVDQQLGYLRSWSSTNRYIAENGSDPVLLIEEKLRAVWGANARTVRWPLTLKVGRTSK